MSTPSDQGTKAPKRNAKADACYSIAMAMAGAKSPLPGFDHRFVILGDEHGAKRYVEVGPKDVCIDVMPEYVDDCILKYFVQIKHTVKVNLMPSDMAQVRKAFRGLSPTMHEDDIAPILQKSTAGLTWNRMPFDVVPMPTPVFDEIMSRTTNWRAVMAYIGSIFDRRSDIQQYLWLSGDGMNSKGRLFYQLSEVLGSGYAPEQPPRGDSKRFWAHGVQNKRLVVFHDCDDTAFCTSGFFKSLTGGEPQRIEIKGGATYKATIPAKFCFLSNEKPDVSGSKADRRRAIYAEMKPITGDPIPEAEYNAKLAAEMPGVIYKCMAMLKELAPRGGVIPVDTEGLNRLVRTTEEEFEDFFTARLTSDENGQIERHSMRELMMDYGWRDNHKQKRFKAWLKREKGVREDRMSVSRVWAYFGVRALGNCGDPGY